MNRSRLISRVASLGLTGVIAVGLLISAAHGAERANGELIPTFTAANPSPGSMTISMAPGSQSGESFQVKIMVTGVDDFFGAAFFVAFDPTVAAFVNYSPLGTLIEAAGGRSAFFAVERNPGMLDVAATRLGQELAGIDALGSQLLLLLNFRAIAETEGSSFTFSQPEEVQICPLETQPCTALNDALTWSGGVLVVAPGNQPPEVHCANPTIASDPGQCGAVVNCSAIASCTDPDGDPITLSCDPGSPYGVGMTQVTATCSDGQDITAAECTIAVVDEVPPHISVSMEPSALWPPKHRMIDVQAIVEAGDNCGTPTVILASVASDEDDNAPGGGDGNTSNDIQNADLGTADFEMSLRAERAGSGNGRTYTIVYTAVDAAGNSASAEAFVLVPRDQGRAVDPGAM